MKFLRLGVALWLGWRAFRATRSLAVGCLTGAAVWMFLPAVLHIAIAEVSHD